jgi:fatty acid desaturase
VGDVWTLTVQEYLESSRLRRFAYRLARNPVVLFVIAPLALFLVWQRFPSPRASRRERRSVYWMNLAIVGVATGMSAIFGVVPYLVLQLTAMMVAGSSGIWLFYIQHQFEGTYWQSSKNWDYTAAALQGKLVLQAAQNPPVVLGKHRLSSHPSSQPAHSQLSLAEVPRVRPDVRGREACDVARESESLHVPVLG